MKAVTIDQLQMKDHVRWAEDQNSLDISLITDSPLVAPHPEILGSSALYPSQCDLLFELHKRNSTWALFEAPKQFHLFSKRFFSHRLFSSCSWEREQHSERDNNSNPEEKKEEDADTPARRPSSDAGFKKIMEIIADAHRPQHQTTSLFEKDKTTLLNLIESIEWINSMLLQIHGRKLQYQKG